MFLRHSVGSTCNYVGQCTHLNDTDANSNANGNELVTTSELLN